MFRYCENKLKSLSQPPSLSPVLLEDPLDSAPQFLNPATKRKRKQASSTPQTALKKKAKSDSGQIERVFQVDLKGRRSLW